jgi:hypothetical protein
MVCGTQTTNYKFCSKICRLKKTGQEPRIRHCKFCGKETTRYKFCSNEHRWLSNRRKTSARNPNSNPHLYEIKYAYTDMGDHISYKSRQQNARKLEDVIMDREVLSRPDLMDNSWYIVRRRTLPTILVGDSTNFADRYLGPPPKHTYEQIVPNLDFRKSNLRLVRNDMWDLIGELEAETEGDTVRLKLPGEDGVPRSMTIDLDVYEQWKDTLEVKHARQSKYDVCSTKHDLYGTFHRLICQAPRGKVVDHINGNTLDNRRSNLRICDVKDNVRNRIHLHPKNKTGINGVCIGKNGNQKGKFLATFTLPGKGPTTFGPFETKEEAYACRRALEIKHWGEFAPRVPPSKKNPG